MYAVFEDRNQQFRVRAGDRVLLPFDSSRESGSSVTFDKVCAVTGDGDAKIGTPYVDGASVSGRVLGVVKGPKIYVQKFKRRKNHRRRTGFRACFTEVEISAIDS